MISFLKKFEWPASEDTRFFAKKSMRGHWSVFHQDLLKPLGIDVEDDGTGFGGRVHREGLRGEAAVAAVRCVAWLLLHRISLVNK